MVLNLAIHDVMYVPLSLDISAKGMILQTPKQSACSGSPGRAGNTRGYCHEMQLQTRMASHLAKPDDGDCIMNG